VFIHLFTLFKKLTLILFNSLTGKQQTDKRQSMPVTLLIPTLIASKKPTSICLQIKYTKIHR